MSSKATNDSKGNAQSFEDWMPTPTGEKVKPAIPDNENRYQQIREFMRADVSTEPGIVSRETKIVSEIDDSNDTVQTVSKRISVKQRKESLEEYRETFLKPPTIEDRKPVFVSRELRDRLDEVARKLGGRRMSVSGLVENLVRHHLLIYMDDFEVWKKL